MLKRVIAISILLTVSLAAQADSASIEDAKTAAIEWLALVDGHEYEKSWFQASNLLRQEVPQSDWVSNLGNMRGSLGKLNERIVNSSEYHESLPEAPDGQYVIFTFDSLFEHNKFAAEVVAMAKGDDLSWRVVGYYFA